MDRRFYEELAPGHDRRVRGWPPHRSRPPVSEQGLQARAIGFWGALAMSVAAMGPLLGALGVAPLIVGEAGFSAPFIFVICWIAMVAVALTIGRFTRLLPGAASIYSYVAHGLGERLGFLTGWLSFSYYVLFVPLLMTAFGIYAEAAAADVFGISVTWWIWSLLGMAIVFGLAMTGIALSMRIDLALAVIADGFLLLVSAVIIAKVIGDGAFTLEPLAPTNAPGDFTGLSLAIAFGVLIFLGFEQSFVLGEETTDPRATCPRRSTPRWRSSASCCSCRRSRWCSDSASGGWCASGTCWRARARHGSRWSGSGSARAGSTCSR